MIRFVNGTIVLHDRLLLDGAVLVRSDRIESVGTHVQAGASDVDLDSGCLLPGFVDLHVHGGDGADFMDGTAEAFPRSSPHTPARNELHADHDSCSHDQLLTFLQLCLPLTRPPVQSARRPHLWPYFAPTLRVPAATVRSSAGGL